MSDLTGTRLDLMKPLEELPAVDTVEWAPWWATAGEERVGDEPEAVPSLARVLLLAGATLLITSGLALLWIELYVKTYALRG